MHLNERARFSQYWTFLLADNFSNVPY